MASIWDRIFARRVSVCIYGLGAIALGLTGLVWGDFAVVWLPGKGYAGPTPLGYAVAVIPLLAGLAMQWQRAAFYSAVALFVPYCFATIFFDVPRGFANPAEFGAWYGVFENSALAAAAFIICTFYARLDAATAERLSRIARVIFGICLIYFGLAHHIYLANTVSYIPAWLPPGQTFWAYATGAGHVLAGIALISGVYARLAAMLLTAMFIIFTVLVHAHRVLVTLPHNHFAWGENAVNIALIGAAWVVAASIAPAGEKTKT
ncbi:MAG TPA: DoxX family protein [Steroidobacteraceae bacterium]